MGVSRANAVFSLSLETWDRVLSVVACVDALMLPILFEEVQAGLKTSSPFPPFQSFRLKTRFRVAVFLN